MTYTNARYGDAEQTVIIVEIDGVVSCVPTRPSNRHYAEMIQAGITPAPYSEGE